MSLGGVNKIIVEIKTVSQKFPVMDTVNRQVGKFGGT